jgi:hypothetical protein
MKKGIRITLKILAVPTSIAIVIALFGLIAMGLNWFQDYRYSVKAKKQTSQVTQKPQQPQKPMNENFVLAVPGDVWIIQEDNIGLTDVPQTFSDIDQYKAHLNCILMSGTKVEIIKHKVIGYWKFVRTLTGPQRSGWVTGDSVKKAKRVSRF